MVGEGGSVESRLTEPLRVQGYSCSQNPNDQGPAAQAVEPYRLRKCY